MLALEVLLKLPSFGTESAANEVDDNHNCAANDLCTKISSSTLSTNNLKDSSIVNENSTEFDWSQPISVTADDGDDALFLVMEPDGNNNIEENEDYSDNEKANSKKATNEEEVSIKKPDHKNGTHEVTDVIADQLKFMSCLKIMLEELSTLATGFEVDGGQLRYQLYMWLEKEVVVLNHLCNYGYRQKNTVNADSVSEDIESANGRYSYYLT